MSKEIQKSSIDDKGISKLAKALEPAEYTRNNCKFCCSPHRHEAEDMFARHGNVVAVARFLKDKGETLVESSVRNHLRYHFGRKEYEERIKEFGNELDRWRTFRPTKEQRLEEFIDILYRKIHILESQADSTDGHHDPKVSETVAKLIDRVNQCQIEIDKGRGQSDLVYMFMGRFADIVKAHIDGTPSREVAQFLGAALVSILDEVEKVIGELPKNE